MKRVAHISTNPEEGTAEIELVPDSFFRRALQRILSYDKLCIDLPFHFIVGPAAIDDQVIETLVEAADESDETPRLSWPDGTPVIYLARAPKSRFFKDETLMAIMPTKYRDDQAD